MKKLLLFILVLGLSSSIYGQVKRWTNTYSLELGAVILNGSESGSSLTGYDISFTYDHVSLNTSWAGGVTTGYMRTSEDLNNISFVYSTFPVVFQGKWFLAPDTRLAYLQGGIGFHFSKAETIGENGSIILDDAGLMLLIGLGTFFELSENLLITAGYNFNWMNGNIYQNGLVHTLKLGFAFQ